MRQIIIITVLSVLALSAVAQDKNPFIPEIHGTIRAKYEYEPQIDKGRFEIRNARLSVEGKVIPIVRYKAEIDLSDEGTIKMLDAYTMFLAEIRNNFSFGSLASLAMPCLLLAVEKKIKSITLALRVHAGVKSILM